MAKEAYYFSHDSNARHDPKITAMRSVYGSEGYGWFWIIVEMMREANEYKLEMQGKYTFNAYAMQMHTDCNAAEQFVHDCINEFELFHSDGTHFWSPSLLRRMNLREQTSEVRRAAALTRWGKDKSKSEDAMQMHDVSNANAMQGKERKVNKKESKNNEKKEYADYVFLSETEYGKLTELLGEDERNNYFLRFASWISGQPKRVQESRSAYLTILNWHRESEKRPQRHHIPNTNPNYGKVSVISKLQQLHKEAEEKDREASGHY